MSERDIVELIRMWKGVWLPMDLGRKAADEIERLRSAYGETEPSVSTRTPEHGLSYHDETEALREQLLKLAAFWEGHCPEDDGVEADCVDAVGSSLDECAKELRRALSQHVGGEG